MWTDENRGFRKRWCHTSYNTYSVRDATVFSLYWCFRVDGRKRFVYAKAFYVNTVRQKKKKTLLYQTRKSTGICKYFLEVHCPDYAHAWRLVTILSLARPPGDLKSLFHLPCSFCNVKLVSEAYTCGTSPHLTYPLCDYWHRRPWLAAMILTSPYGSYPAFFLSFALSAPCLFDILPVLFSTNPYQTICILKLILKYLKCNFSIWTLFSCILILFDKNI